MNGMDIKKTNKETFAVPIKEWCLSVISVILAAAFMPFFTYASNSTEANFSDILFPLVLFIAIGIVLLLVIAVFTRSLSKAALGSILVLLVLENYHMIEKVVKIVLPGLKYWHILPIVLVLVFHVIFLVCRLIKKENESYITLISTIVFGALIAVNLVTAIPNVFSRLSVVPVDKPDKVTEISNTNVDTNIYYFVLDEAASFKTLKNFYNYDAADFRNYLEGNGFFISEDSHNECGNTIQVLTNLINLDYVASGGLSNSEILRYTENPELLKYLKKHNYELIGVGDTNWLNIQSVTSSNSGGATSIDGFNIAQIILRRSFLYSLFELDANSDRQTILSTYDYYADDVYSEKSKFMFTYLCSPHQPFVFDENGGTVSADHYADWADKKYYLGQYKFLMKKTMEAVDNIIRNDPESIIVIVSDHGPRFVPEMTYNDQINILNAVYFKGKPLEEIDGESIVNSLRIILSKLFDENLPVVEVVE